MYTQSNDECVDRDRRYLLGIGAAAVAMAQLSMVHAGMAQPKSTNASFSSLKQVNAGLLDVGYAEVGPADGPVVVLLHGWPYDIHSYADVAPLLADAGYRVLVPHLRGYGTTRFLSEATFRNGQQAALGVDLIEFMDALGVEKAILGGYDWGARTANVVAALWPERCKAMVSVSGYLIGSQAANEARFRLRPS